MITFESVVRKFAKENKIKLTPQEKREMREVEAMTAAPMQGKLWAILKISGALALIGGIYYYFKVRPGMAAASAPAAPITP